MMTNVKRTLESHLVTFWSLSLKLDLKRNSLLWKKVEKAMNENDTDLHLSSRQSYRGRQNHRLAQSFESKEEVTERARITPPKRKEKSHTPATENITGDLEQLLTGLRKLRSTKYE